MSLGIGIGLFLRSLGSSATDYLLMDRFITTRTGGNVDGTPTEPGPGGSRIVNDGSDLVIVRRKFLDMSEQQLDSVWNDPDIYYGPFGDDLKAVNFMFEQTGSWEDGPVMALASSLRPASPTQEKIGLWHFEIGSGGNLWACPGTEGGPTAMRVTAPNARLRAIRYLVSIIRRPGGGAWFILSGGIYGDGTLVWVADEDDFAGSLYPGISEKKGLFRFDHIYGVKQSGLDADFLTRYGLALDADTFTRADSGSLGSTEAGSKDWTEIDNGGSISSNRLALAGNGGAIFNVGSQPRIIDVDIIPPGSGTIDVRLYFRCASTGAFNNTLSVNVSATAVRLYVNGVQVRSAPYGVTHGITNRLRVIDWGDTVRVYVNSDLAFEEPESTNVDASHYYVGLYRYTSDAGTVHDNIRCWPASVIQPSSLGAVPDAPTGTGGAVDSDDFTDGDGVALTTHNADWTTAWVDTTWEINSNKARMVDTAKRGAALQETGLTDVEVEADVTLPIEESTVDPKRDWWCGLFTRWTSTNTYIHARLIHGSDREIEVRQYIGGVDSLISMAKMGAGNLEPGSTHNFRLAVKGEEVSAYLDDELTNTARTTLLTGTKVGIGVAEPAQLIGQPSWDNFQYRNIA